MLHEEHEERIKAIQNYLNILTITEANEYSLWNATRRIGDQSFLNYQPVEANVQN